MHISPKVLIALPAAGALAMLTMGNSAGCSSTNTSGSSSTVNVSTAGGGSVAVRGVMLRRVGVKGENNAWIPLTALAAGSAAAAAAGAAAGAWTHTTTRMPAPNAVNANLGVGDPCFDSSKHIPRPLTTKIAEITTRRIGIHIPFLDCAGMYAAVRKHGLPARIKSIVECVARIMADGTLIKTADVSTWHFKGGVAAVDNSTGRIIGARPTAGRTWTQCAKGK